MNTILSRYKILPSFQDDRVILTGSSQKICSTERYDQKHLCGIQLIFKGYINKNDALHVSIHKKHSICNSKTQMYYLLGFSCVKRTQYLILKVQGN